MTKTPKLPDFTDSGYKYFSAILMTLGKKTKQLFISEIVKEADESLTDTHQMMTNADVIRVADKLKIDYKEISQSLNGSNLSAEDSHS